MIIMTKDAFFIIMTAENREIKTWGWGEHGQLGLGDTCDQINPLTVSLGYDLNEDKAIRVYCGSGFTYTVTTPRLLSQT